MTATQLVPSPSVSDNGRSGAPRRWWILAVVGLAQLMITVDVTIVNIALPAAQRDLGISDASRQWVITAYALAFGSLLLISGRVADLVGRRTTLLVGLAVFGAGSALGGAAPTFTVLVLGRVAQGVGGSLLAPAALATVTATFTQSRERTRAIGIFGAIAVAGGAIGLLLGGALTEHLDWRFTMYVNLVLAVVAIVGGIAFLEHDARPERRALDLIGTVLVTSSLFGLVFGFSNAESHSWHSPGTWAVLVASVVLLIAFFARQARITNPLLPIRVLIDRDRGASFSALLTVNVGVFAVFLFLTYYLQLTLHYTPVKTGLAFLPIILGTATSSLVGANVLSRRIGPKYLVPSGMLLASGSLAWFTRLDVTSAYLADILPPLLLLGIGLGFVYASSLDLATSGLEPEDAGVAGAAVNTTQQIGGSIGVALLSTLAASAATHYTTQHAGPAATVQLHATLHSYSTAYAIAAAVFAAGAFVVGLLYRPGIPALVGTDR